MRYELYIDAFFLLNFFMDTLLLFLIRKILKCTATHLGILLGGAFGGGMACVLMALPGIPAWGKLFAGYGVISICMIKISFHSLRPGAVLQAAIALYGAAFLLGGVLEFLTVHLPFFQKYGMSAMGICMTGLTVYALVSFFAGRRKQQKNSVLLLVKLVWKERSLSFTALLDTGNSLHEPISGKPVSIAERAAFEAVWGKLPPEGIRVIPYHSIGKAHGILPGYEMTRLIIFGEHEKIEIEKPMVGLLDGKVSADSAYQMILHPTLIKNQEEKL